MKKETKQQIKNTLIKAGVLATLAASILGLGACSKSPTVDPNPTTPPTETVAPTQIGTPIVIVSPTGKVSWSAFENATGYKLYVNGKEIKLDADTISYQIPDMKGGETYTVSVQALGNGNTYLTSEISNEKSLKFFGTLAAAKNLSCEDGNVTWDAVEGAVGYKIVIDGVEHTSTQPSFTLTPADGKTYNIKVFAVGDGIKNEVETSASAVINYTYALDVLNAPQNLKIAESGLVTWDAVENAVNYVLSIDDQEYTLTETSKQLTFVENQKYDVSVKAVGDGVNYSAIRTNEATLDYTHTITRQALATPVVSIVNNQFVWSAVENAQNYAVSFNGEPFEGEVIVLPSGEMAVDIMSLPLDKTEISVAAKPEGGSKVYKVSEAATCKFDLESHLKTLYEAKYGVSNEFMASMNTAFIDSSYKDSPVRYGAGITTMAVNAGNITYRHFEGDTSKIGNIPDILNNQKFSRFPTDEGRTEVSYGMEMLEFYTEHTTAGNAYTFGKQILANQEKYDVACFINTALSPGHTAPGQYVKYVVQNKETKEITHFAIAIYISPTAGYAGQIQMKADRGNLRTHGLSWFFQPNKSYFSMESSYYFYQMEGQHIIAGEKMLEQEAEAEVVASADTGVALSDGSVAPATTKSVPKLYDVQELLKFAMSKYEAEQRAINAEKEIPNDTNPQQTL